MRDALCTEFNGYIFIDPEVKVGHRANIDRGYSNGGPVYVHSLNNIFATVSDTENSSRWSTMRNRLTRLTDPTTAGETTETTESQSQPSGAHSVT